MGKKIQNNKAGISAALDYIESELGKYKLNRRDITMNMLTAEETIVSLMEHAPESSEIDISFSKFLGNINMNISAPGELFDISESKSITGDMELDGMDEDMEHAIRGIVLRARGDSFRYKNKMHRNTVQIKVKQSDKMQLYLTLGALFAAILLGVIFRAALPQAAQNSLNTYLLTPVKDMFLNALKMIIAPVVFFSIVSCISQFDSLKELGKIGAKVMGMYLLTTIIAILVGLLAFSLIKPGDSSLAALISDAADSTVEAAGSASISILDTIVNIVPSNFVKPFIESDMLQIIFMAVICGAAVGMIGDFSKPLKDFFEACNLLFLKITTIIVKVIPLAVLCSMTSMVMTTGVETLYSILSFFGTFLLGMLMMLGVYCLLVLLIARLNPIVFLKKHSPAMLTTFSLSSSNAAMPLNIDSCKKLGVPSKVCAFSIPLGATVNMDGSCVYLIVAGLFLAKVFGVTVDGSAMFSLIFSVFVLSIGAPGIPGAGLVCLSVLLVQMGVPTSAISLVMGIDSIISMFRAAMNTTGDVAVSLIVAKTEKLLDIKTYKQG
ncbi:MAG: dicarboxylate/amino acid:cation symporter [Eubacteriales bacterium]|nr:dicarboxylate/amino acid:cation symporter [Eubacteriales bacterium]